MQKISKTCGFQTGILQGSFEDMKQLQKKLLVEKRWCKLAFNIMLCGTVELYSLVLSEKFIETIHCKFLKKKLLFIRRRQYDDTDKNIVLHNNNKNKLKNKYLFAEFLFVWNFLINSPNR